MTGVRFTKDGKGWIAKIGKYIHSRGCGANTSEPCTCEPPYPICKTCNGTRQVFWGPAGAPDSDYGPCPDCC